MLQAVFRHAQVMNSLRSRCSTLCSTLLNLGLLIMQIVNTSSMLHSYNLVCSTYQESDPSSDLLHANNNNYVCGAWTKLVSFLSLDSCNQMPCYLLSQH